MAIHFVSRSAFQNVIHTVTFSVQFCGAEIDVNIPGEDRHNIPCCYRILCSNRKFPCNGSSICNTMY